MNDSKFNKMCVCNFTNKGILILHQQGLTGDNY